MGGGGRARRAGGRALVLEAVRRHGAALEVWMERLDGWTDERMNGYGQRETGELADGQCPDCGIFPSLVRGPPAIRYLGVSPFLSSIVLSFNPPPPQLPHLFALPPSIPPRHLSRSPVHRSSAFSVPLSPAIHSHPRHLSPPASSVCLPPLPPSTCGFVLATPLAVRDTGIPRRFEPIPVPRDRPRFSENIPNP